MWVRSALSPPACLPSSPPFPKRSQSLWLAAQETIPRESLKTRLCSESRRAYGELCAAWLWGELSPVGGKGSTRRSVGHGGVGEAFFGGGFVPPQPPLHPSEPPRHSRNTVCFLMVSWLSAELLLSTNFLLFWNLPGFMLHINTNNGK